MSRVVIYTDGACKGNPGPGGWGVYLRYGEIEKDLCGGAAQTTNNRMELQAVIEALRALNRPCQVDFYLDSEYVRQGITAWMANWKARGWRTADKKPVKNEDLWRILDELLSQSGHAIVSIGSRAIQETRATSVPTRSQTRGCGKFKQIYNELIVISSLSPCPSSIKIPSSH